MFRPIEDLPDGVIGLEVTGEVHAKDYADVLAPMFEEARSAGDKVRLLYAIGDDAEITGGAAWADTKFGVQNFTAFERIAVVTDRDWLADAVKALGWIMPGDVRAYPHADRADAIEWLAGD